MALDGFAVAEPFGAGGADALGEAQADEEALLVGVGGGFFGGASGQVIRDFLGVFAAGAAVEGVGARAEAGVGGEFPVLQVVERFAATNSNTSRPESIASDSPTPCSNALKSKFLYSKPIDMP